MLTPSKALWIIRTVLASPFYGQIQMPSYIAPTLSVKGRKRIFVGRRVRILPGLFAETHQQGSIRVGDDVAVGQGVHITAMGDLRIGSGTTVTGYVTITDIDHEYEAVDVPVHAQPLRFAETRVGNNCFIGMGARLQAGTILGDGCIVGANAVLKGTFPPYSVIVGVPGKVVKSWDAETRAWVRK